MSLQPCVGCFFMFKHEGCESSSYHESAAMCWLLFYVQDRKAMSQVVIMSLKPCVVCYFMFKTALWTFACPIFRNIGCCLNLFTPVIGPSHFRNMWWLPCLSQAHQLVVNKHKLFLLCLWLRGVFGALESETNWQRVEPVYSCWLGSNLNLESWNVGDCVAHPLSCNQTQAVRLSSVLKGSEAGGTQASKHSGPSGQLAVSRHLPKQLEGRRGSEPKEWVLLPWLIGRDVMTKVKDVIVWIWGNYTTYTTSGIMSDSGCYNFFKLWMALWFNYLLTMY